MHPAAEAGVLLLPASLPRQAQEGYPLAASKAVTSHV